MINSPPEPQVNFYCKNVQTYQASDYFSMQSFIITCVLISNAFNTARAVQTEKATKSSVIRNLILSCINTSSLFWLVKIRSDSFCILIYSWICLTHYFNRKCSFLIFSHSKNKHTNAKQNKKQTSEYKIIIIITPSKICCCREILSSRLPCFPCTIVKYILCSLKHMF